MQARPLFYPPLQNPNLKPFSCYFSAFFNKPQPPLSLPRSHISHFPSKHHLNRFIRNCVAPAHEPSHFNSEITEQNGGFENVISSNSVFNHEPEEEDNKRLENQSLWSQMNKIIKFMGPATGLWISGPLMSLIDTAVIGQGSSIEIAALGTFSSNFFPQIGHFFFFLLLSL